MFLVDAHGFFFVGLGWLWSVVFMGDFVVVGVGEESCDSFGGSTDLQPHLLLSHSKDKAIL